MRRLVINLDDTDRVKEFKTEELFQLAAFEQVGRILKEKASKLKKLNLDNAGDEITNCRIHDTIFVAGDRGTGKTAFMLNIKKFIVETDSETANSFAFLKPIDPTILEEDEHFLSIIVGHIIEAIEKQRRIYQTTNKEEEKEFEAYYDALDKISESIRAVRSIKTDQGIDEIVSSQTTLKLEQNSHKFFKVAAKTFKREALVILIDDIDMCFNKGYQVLEVIRKYLASPYIIPVVSGEPSLYHKILIKHFEDKLYLKYMSKESHPEYSDVKYTEYIENLCEKYLVKVFPNENRIILKNIFDIMRETETILLVDANKQCSYNLFKDIEIRCLNYLINQKEFTKEVLTDNTRLFIQYLVTKKEIIGIIADKFPSATADCVHKPYTPSAQIMKDIDNFIRQYVFDADYNLYLESIRKTAEIYTQVRDRELLTVSAKNDIKAISGGEYFHYKAFKAGFFSKEINRSYKPDPEMIIENLFIAKSKENVSAIKKLSENDVMLYLIFELLTYDDFYTSYQTKKFILAGKFFELMIASLDSEHLNINHIKSIINSQPFNANIKNNKYIRDGGDLNNAEEFSITYQYKESKYHELLIDINKWHNELKIDKSDILPTLFIHNVANKFFNNLNVLKMGGYDPKQYEPGSVQRSDRWVKHTEPAIVFFQRIAMIFINSIASFENTSTVANINIAVGETFELKICKKNDNAFRINIEPLLAEDNSFTKAFYMHPLIRRLIGDGAEAPPDESITNIMTGIKQPRVPSVKAGTVTSENKMLKKFISEYKNVNSKKFTASSAEEYLNKIFEYLTLNNSSYNTEDRVAILDYLQKPTSKPGIALKMVNPDQYQYFMDSLTRAII